MPDVHHDALPDQIGAFSKYEEDQRLAVLAQRIERRKQILAEDYAERRRINARIIKRRRRAEGKS